MMDREKLQDAVNSKFIPIYAASYSEVKDSLQDKHGQRGWIGALAQAITGSASRNGKEYLAARRSIERYEKGQFKEMKKYSPQLAKVGKQLPPIGKRLPGNSITVRVNGTQDGNRDRSWTATFSGADAYTFANNPSYYSFFRKLNYKTGVIESFDGDDSSGVEVTSVA